MARLLVDGEWFEQLAPAALLENEYERILRQNASILFPEYYLAVFKPLVYDEEEGARPDLALVEKQYREWYVVEVENVVHSLEKHVVPQVKTLSNAAYGEQEAARLQAELPDLDFDRLGDMLKGTQPRVVVIINEHRADWILALARYNAIVMVVELFRSARNRHVFRVNGQQPSPAPNIVSRCRLDQMLRTWLIVDSPAALDCASGQLVRLRYEGKVTEWERVDSGDRVWLSPRGVNPFSAKETYELLSSSDGILGIRVAHHPRY